MNGIIVGDNFFQSPRTAICRANGAHRIATMLRKEKIKVEIVDFINAWSEEEITNLAESIDHLDFLGISNGLGQLNSNKINFLISICKLKWPKLKVVAGGNEVLQNKFVGIDLYFLGFAEGVVPTLVKYLYTGKFDPFKIKTINVDGIKKVVDCNQHFLVSDLSNLKITYSESDFVNPLETLTLETSRGCIFKCEFCNFPFTGKKKNEYIRVKEDIKNELIDNYKKFGTTRYLITDDTFNDNIVKVDMLYDISKEIDFKLSFMCYARVDLLSHKDQLRKMVEFGVKGMYFGIESLKPETAKKIGKGFTGEKLKNYLVEIKNLYPELHITTSWITGLPNESIDEFETNLKWVVDHKACDSFKVLNLTIPRDNESNYTSPFTKSWPNHGYQEMTTLEVRKYLKKHNLTELTMAGQNIDTYLKHNIPWKNDHMNFIEAYRYSLNLGQKYKNFISVSGWFGFCQSFFHNDLIRVLHTKKYEYDWNLQQLRVNEFIEEYKLKKVKHLQDMLISK